MAAAAVSGALTLTGVTTPWWLLAFACVVPGGGDDAPAWQAITSELVPREEVPSAVALSGVGLNLARAGGPALGHFIVAAAGPSGVFLLNAVSCVGSSSKSHRWPLQLSLWAVASRHLTGATRAPRLGMRRPSSPSSCGPPSLSSVGTLSSAADRPAGDGLDSVGRRHFLVPWGGAGAAGADPATGAPESRGRLVGHGSDRHLCARDRGPGYCARGHLALWDPLCRRCAWIAPTSSYNAGGTVGGPRVGAPACPGRPICWVFQAGSALWGALVPRTAGIAIAPPRAGQ